MPDPDPARRLYSLFPARCPLCSYVTNIVVGHQLKVTLQVHNRCHGVIYYRCWIAENCPVPRVEFLDPANAMELMLRRDGGHVVELPDPSPPRWAFPHAKRRRGGGRR